MSSSAKKILHEALALPDDEQAALVGALTESLERVEDDLSPEWQGEITRRIEAVERGESKLLPWDDVEARIQAALRKI